MKFAIVFVALFAVAFAVYDDSKTEVLKYDNDRNDAGEYSYTVELSDGTIRHEEGKLVDVGKETEHMEIQGYFIYNGPDGKLYRTEYQANADGYQAQGEHIPKNEENYYH